MQGDVSGSMGQNGRASCGLRLDQSLLTSFRTAERVSERGTQSCRGGIAAPGNRMSAASEEICIAIPDDIRGEATQPTSCDRSQYTLLRRARRSLHTSSSACVDVMPSLLPSGRKPASTARTARLRSEVPAQLLAEPIRQNGVDEREDH